METGRMPVPPWKRENKHRTSNIERRTLNIEFEDEDEPSSLHFAAPRDEEEEGKHSTSNIQHPMMRTRLHLVAARQARTRTNREMGTG
jgi:hypothetical protein